MYQSDTTEHLKCVVHNTLNTLHLRQYSNMNMLHTSHGFSVPVKHHRTLEVCRLEYLRTLRMRQYSNMNWPVHTLHESRVPFACFGTLTELRGGR